MSWGILFFFVASGAAEVAQSRDFEDTMVQLSMGRKFHGIVYQDGMLPQLQVYEKILLEGAFVDSGHIVSYLGSHGLDLDDPVVEIFLHPGDSGQVPLRLVGVDERLSLAVLEHPGPFKSALSRYKSSLPSEIRVAYSGETGWRLRSCKVVRWDTGRMGLGETVQLRPRELPEEPGLWEGGFLLDFNHRVLGLVTRVDRHPLGRSLTCRVLRWSSVRRSVKQVVSRRGHVRSGWLGIYVQSDSVGLEIEEIVPESPAAYAGLLPGDVVLKVAQYEMTGLEDLVQTIRWQEPGSQLELMVRRGKVTRRITAKLATRIRAHVAWRMELPTIIDQHLVEELRLQKVLLPVSPGLGLVATPWIPDGAKIFSELIEKGLLVKSVGAASVAHRVGLRSGDILIRVNGLSVGSLGDLRRSSRVVVGGFLIVEYLRGGKLQTQRLRLP